MKRLICCILVGIFIFALFSGCTDKGGASSSEENMYSISENLSEEIKALLKENDYCNREIFMMSNLPKKGEAVRDNIFLTDSEKFPDYKAFENYLSGIYREEYVDLLLSDFPEEGNPLYLNIEGRLCINEELRSARAYFADWSSPRIEITEVGEDFCKFNATVLKEEPGDPPIKEYHSVNSVAYFEKGKWVLEKIIY